HVIWRNRGGIPDEAVEFYGAVVILLGGRRCSRLRRVQAEQCLLHEAIHPECGVLIGPIQVGPGPGVGSALFEFLAEFKEQIEIPQQIVTRLEAVASCSAEAIANRVQSSGLAEGGTTVREVSPNVVARFVIEPRAQALGEDL